MAGRSEQKHTVEVEVKAPGLAGPILELLSRSPNTGSYILFSGDPVYVEEMQAAVRKNGKPTGLRMGANMRRLTEETKRMIPNMDLFEVGLNADAFTCEDVRWLGEHGIHVFSNLGDYHDWWEKMVTRGVLGFKTNLRRGVHQLVEFPALSFQACRLLVICRRTLTMPG